MFFLSEIQPREEEEEFAEIPCMLTYQSLHNKKNKGRPSSVKVVYQKNYHASFVKLLKSFYENMIQTNISTDLAYLEKEVYIPSVYNRPIK